MAFERKRAILTYKCHHMWDYYNDLVDENLNFRHFDKKKHIKELA